MRCRRPRRARHALRSAACAVVTVEPRRSGLAVRRQRRSACPAPVEREVAVAHGGAASSSPAGSTAAQQSTNGVYLLEPRTPARSARSGSVPAAVPRRRRCGDRRTGSSSSAAARRTSSASVQRVRSPARAPRRRRRTPRAATLRPRAAADRRGRLPRRRLRRCTTPCLRSTEPTTASISISSARLPVGLRYPAVATANGDVFIAGGVSANWTLLCRVPVRSRGLGQVSTVGQLPGASAHASRGRGRLGDRCARADRPAVSARIDLATPSAVVPAARPPCRRERGSGRPGTPSSAVGGDVAGRIVGTDLGDPNALTV